ncbi:MAG: hypothetical protein ACM34H_03950 [Deltaproteobacteria bacterium]
MKLWETYFRLWNRLSEVLSEKTTQSEDRENPIQKEEERGSSYYGYLCDEGTCIESGV